MIEKLSLQDKFPDKIHEHKISRSWVGFFTNYVQFYTHFCKISASHISNGGGIWMQINQVAGSVWQSVTDRQTWLQIWAPLLQL